ncbi:hypothetical protein [Candidatus Clostridium stratigraminis]|uniref:Uncharacterized protein n=1 Tax=Candidatus Clostridium stratigraminis TaxID=3381661 RepID=A0ABW8T3C1_9CLOT
MNKKNLSEDKLRSVVDGFRLDEKDTKSNKNGYITTDQGVYSTPDYALDNTKKDNKIIKGRIKGTSAFNIIQSNDIDNISWSNNNYDHSKLNNETNSKK